MAEVEQPLDTRSAPIVPLAFPSGYVPGKYALGSAPRRIATALTNWASTRTLLEDMTQNVNKCDAAARIWEVSEQAWEQRLFRRNYHFLNAGWKGWGMFGGSSGTSGASILQTQNAMKLFSCNIYGARHKKIVSLLAREVPAMLTAPVDDADPMDQSASEEAEKYSSWCSTYQADLPRAIKKAWRAISTPGRPRRLPDVHPR